jgi:hypothetical protein
VSPVEVALLYTLVAGMRGQGIAVSLFSTRGSKPVSAMKFP